MHNFGDVQIQKVDTILEGVLINPLQDEKLVSIFSDRILQIVIPNPNMESANKFRDCTYSIRCPQQLSLEISDLIKKQEESKNI